MASAVFLSEMRAVVKRYLAADVSLGTAAHQLSSIIGSSIIMRAAMTRSHVKSTATTDHVTPLTVQIAHLQPEQVVPWLGLGHRRPPRLSDVTLGFGGSLADWPKVTALIQVALSHLQVWHHVWQRFGRDAA